MGMKQNKWRKKNVKIWKEIEKPETIVNLRGVYRINGGKCPLCSGSIEIQHFRPKNKGFTPFPSYSILSQNLCYVPLLGQ
jgi:hypothetical protein